MTSPSSRPAAMMARPALFLLILLAASALLGLNPQRASAAIHYVTMNGTGDGSTWAKAGPLQTVITKAKSGDQVWVAYGAYTGNFTATNGVAVYGHFVGTETSLSQRPLTKATYASIMNANGSGTVYTIPTTATGTNTLDGFTVQGGTNRGINDSSGDKLVIANCTVSNNSVNNNGNGGGLYTQGVTINISNSTFTGNSATNDQGGGTNEYGGGIYTSSGTTAVISNCNFTGNSATQTYYASGYGGAISTAGTATINTCTINTNNASSQGGGVYATGKSIAINNSTLASNTNGGFYAGTGSNTISGCTFTTNNGRGAAVFGSNTSTISRCTFAGNSANNFGNGGGLYAGSLTTTIIDCAFNNNSATNDQGGGDVEYGGGLYLESGTTTAISRCSFTGNKATQTYYSYGTGGGIGGYGTPYITNCTFNDDSPDEIDLEDVGTEFVPALIADNLIYGSGTAAGNGIDLAINGSSTAFAYVIVSNNTIVNNNAALNIGTGSDTGGAVEVANNLFYKNNGGVNYNASATFTSSHNDLSGNTYKYQGAALDPTDITATPKFLSATFGNADYLFPAPGSPLIDAGDDSYVAEGDTDLAGNPRILGRAVDIGAYEAPTDSAATVTALSPTAVQAGHAAFTLTVTGTGFMSGATVSFGSISLPATFVSSTKLTLTVPAADVAAAQTLSVAVVNPTMQASNGMMFTVSAAPTLTSLSPTSKPTGSASFTLTLNGTGFLSGAVVTFGGTDITAVTVTSSTQLTATVPASLLTAQGSVAVTETNPQTSMTNALTFTLTTPIATLSALSPASALIGNGGLTITLTGTYFQPGAVVKWNSTTLTSALFSSTAMAAQVPASLLATAGTATVTVTNPGVAASNSQTFTITALPAAAKLTTLSPSTAQAGSAGFTLTVAGMGFVSGATVKWNGTSLTSAYFSGTTVVAQVPSSLLATAGTASVTVVNPGAAASNALMFKIAAPPAPATLTSLSPSSVKKGSAGFMLSVTGTGFISGAVIQWNGTSLNSAYFNATTVVALVPASLIASAGTASVTVVNPSAAASGAKTFTITP